MAAKASKKGEKKVEEAVVEEAAPAVVYTKSMEGEVKLFNKWCVPAWLAAASP